MSELKLEVSSYGTINVCKNSSDIFTLFMFLNDGVLYTEIVDLTFIIKKYINDKKNIEVLSYGEGIFLIVLKK